jgi:cellulose synthase/poly-beta-1,6-N-acetylglucosamine synthase-like glycosyltransferase
MTDVVVVVPARDEEDLVATTLWHIVRSVEHARRHGLVRAARIELVAHRCTDRTVDRARHVLSAVPFAHVTRDDTAETVGRVRHAAARRGLGRLGGPAHSTWVLSTDADSRVGTSWVADVVDQGRRADAVAVVGLAPLDTWTGSPAGAAAYTRVLDLKMRSERGHHQHDHVYGANLAVRADAYLDVGGFPDVRLGEDQALVDALAARGHRVLRTASIRVTTSGRHDGRADGGLADHLLRIEAEQASSALSPLARESTLP